MQPFFINSFISLGIHGSTLAKKIVFFVLRFLDPSEGEGDFRNKKKTCGVASFFSFQDATEISGEKKKTGHYPTAPGTRVLISDQLARLGPEANCVANRDQNFGHAFWLRDQ